MGAERLDERRSKNEDQRARHSSLIRGDKEMCILWSLTTISILVSQDSPKKSPFKNDWSATWPHPSPEVRWPSKMVVRHMVSCDIKIFGICERC